MTIHRQYQFLQLTERAEELLRHHEEGSCTCHMGHPPCSYCTDSMSLDALEEDPGWWELAPTVDEGTISLAQRAAAISGANPCNEIILNSNVYSNAFIEQPMRAANLTASGTPTTARANIGSDIQDYTYASEEQQARLWQDEIDACVQAARIEEMPVLPAPQVAMRENFNAYVVEQFVRNILELPLTDDLNMYENPPATSGGRSFRFDVTCSVYRFGHLLTAIGGNDSLVAHISQQSADYRVHAQFSISQASHNGPVRLAITSASVSRPVDLDWRRSGMRFGSFY